MICHVRHRHGMTGCSSGFFRRAHGVSRSGMRSEGCCSRLRHRNFSARPSTSLVNRLTWTQVTRMNFLEKMQDMLGAICRPYGEKAMIRILKRPPRRTVMSRWSRLPLSFITMKLIEGSIICRTSKVTCARPREAELMPLKQQAREQQHGRAVDDRLFGLVWSCACCAGFMLMPKPPREVHAGHDRIILSRTKPGDSTQGPPSGDYSWIGEQGRQRPARSFGKDYNAARPKRSIEIQLGPGLFNSSSLILRPGSFFRQETGSFLVVHGSVIPSAASGQALSGFKPFAGTQRRLSGLFA